MAYVEVSPRSRSIRIALLALGVSALPLGTAFAQSPFPVVRVANDEVSVLASLSPKGEAMMKAVAGTTFEVIYTEGDRYAARKDNWYWVLLPRDAWGTQRVGWLSGNDVEYLGPVRETKPESAGEAVSAEVSGAAQPAARVVEPEPAAASTPKVEVEEVTEVVLNFAFAKSNLTDEAKSKLAGAVAALRSDAKSVTIALEGHADAVGSEPFNEKLGLARAENVKRYLAEQYQIPADKISLVSYGENQPAAPNSTREGRAQNRRVVVKVGSVN
jgi:outer membrane protein OmpA-like peptidoglycan-associated protein